MKRLSVFIAVLIGLGLPTATDATNDDRAAQVLSRFFEVSGGLDQIKKLPGLTAAVRVDAYEYAYSLHLHPDGRFQVEEPNRTTVFDGESYWQSSYGLVDRLVEDRIDQYGRYALNSYCFHDLLGDDGKPASLQFRGTESQHGKNYDVLETVSGDEGKRSYYFNTETGLVDKVIELLPDPEIRERKNIYRYSDYAEVGGIKLFTKSEAVCISDNSVLDPSSRYEFSVIDSPDESLFAKPEATVAAATVDSGVFVGTVIGISGRGSLITSFTQGNVDQLGIIDGSLMAVIARGEQTDHLYVSDIGSATNIGSGDYIAAFNSTPALWIVKAYVGMTSEREYAVGDVVRISKVTNP